MPDTSADWWTVDDVAAYLGVKPATVWRYRHPREARGRPQAVLPPADRMFGRSPAWRPATVTGWKRPGRGARPRA